MFWRMKESTSVHLYFTFILIFTICLSLEQCKADDEAHPFESFCNQTLDCGPSHVIAVFKANVKKAGRYVRSKCNGQHRCQPESKYKCTIKYYCILDHLVQNCSDSNGPENIQTSSNIATWCYRHMKQDKGKNPCWDSPGGFYHHWIILQGIVTIKNESDGDGKRMRTFDLITRNHKNTVCTSSSYIWIIYIGTKSRETPVDIYGKISPKRNSSGFEHYMNITKAYFTAFPDGGKKKAHDDLLKDLSLTKIIIIISAIGGVLVVMAFIIAILWCCCRRCHTATINKSVPEERKGSYIAKDVKIEEPDCQIREGFIPAANVRDTYDSIGFWTDDEDYDPEVCDRNSKVSANIYAMSDCLYRRKSLKNEIYMNVEVPILPPRLVKEKDVYINMNAKPANKHFNVFL